MSSQNVQTSAPSRRVRCVHGVTGTVVFPAVNAARANIYEAIRTLCVSDVAGLVPAVRAALRFDRKRDAIVAFQP